MQDLHQQQYIAGFRRDLARHGALLGALGRDGLGERLAVDS